MRSSDWSSVVCSSVLLRLGLYRLGHARLGDLARDLLDVVRRVVHLAELFLDRLHLLVEVVLALALLHLRLDPAADALLHLLHVDLAVDRSEEHTSELQSLMRISYAVFCLKKKT